MEENNRIFVGFGSYGSFPTHTVELVRKKDKGKLPKVCIPEVDFIGKETRVLTYQKIPMRWKALALTCAACCCLRSSTSSFSQAEVTRQSERI
jgi:hypothetical protein